MPNDFGHGDEDETVIGAIFHFRSEVFVQQVSGCGESTSTSSAVYV